jgi:glucokinase
MILACDVGGTKTLVALFEPRGGALALSRLETYPSREHPSLEAILSRFLASGGSVQPECAGFGVAGAIIAGRAQVTNLEWGVDAARLAAELHLPKVALVNDLVANAWAVDHLGPDDLALLKPGEAAAGGNVAVISAGTGLGEAALVRGGAAGGATAALATEAGHADFAPRVEVEIELLRYLGSRFGHVSYERILAGPGLVNVYRFLRDSGRGDEPAWLAAELAAGDPAPAISHAAVSGRSPLCELALEIFLQVYGAEAGNLCLRTMATGGVFVGGGIAPKVFKALEKVGQAGRYFAAFRNAFVDKGRFATMLEKVPVHLILNDRAALLGAAHFASASARA